MRPTRRAVLLFSLSVPLAMVIVSAWPGHWYFALYLPAAVLAFMATDMIATPSGRRLHVEPSVPAMLYLGRPGAVSAALEMDRGGRREIQALLELTGETKPPGIVSGTMADGRLDLRLPVVPLRRGRVTVQALWLRWNGPLGLTTMRQRRPVGAGIDVVPDVKGIHDAALLFFSREAVFGVKTQRLKGEGTEFENLCDYAQGMDNRLIDWKRSARHRKLLCKEFRQERNHQIVVGFDTGRLMLEPVDGMPKLDHAIKVGLLLSWISLYSGDFIGGCGFDARFRNFLKPGRGMPYFAQFQLFTSGLAYRAEETNFTLGLAELGSRLGRRSLVVLFTEFVDTISAELLIESLQLMARRHVVIFVTMRDPLLTGLQEARPERFPDVAKAVIAADLLRERQIVLERVARLGVHCLDLPAKLISTAVLNRYLMIKQRGLL